MSSVASLSTTSSPLLPLTDLDEPEPDFDIPRFLQSCANLMSHTPMSPSSTDLDPQPIVPAKAHIPPHTSDEDFAKSFPGYSKHNNHYLSASTPHNAHAMATNQTFSAYQPMASPPPPAETSYPVHMPTRQSQSPPSSSYSYTAPSPIASSYPQGAHGAYLPQGTHGPQQQAAYPYPQPPTPQWQSVTDAETAASYDLNAQYESDFGTTTDASTSAAADAPAAASKAAKPPKAKAAKPGRDTIPRPPNAWIIYRSHVLQALGKGENVPGIDKAMDDVGYRNPAAGQQPSSSDEGRPPPKPRIKRGVAPPTEEFLALGSGKTGKGLPQADISKLISYLWKHETPERRRMYETQAEVRKTEHQRLHPGYKFKPMRKSEKLKLREETQRVKEEAKKEAAAARMAGKPKRTPRTRRRHSPIPPISRSSELIPRRDVRDVRDVSGMARTLSYSGNSYLSTGSNSNWEDRLSMSAGVSDPFPMAGESLPALGQDHGAAGAAILSDFWQLRDLQQMTPDLLPATAAMRQESSTDSLNLPPPHVLPESTAVGSTEAEPSQSAERYRAPPAPAAAAPVRFSAGFPLDSQLLVQLPIGQYVGQGVALVNVLGIDDIPALGTSPYAETYMPEVDSLVSSWCYGEESPGGGLTAGDVGGNASGLYAHDKTLQSFVPDDSQQELPTGLFMYSESTPGLPAAAAADASQPPQPLSRPGERGFQPRLQFGIDATNPAREPAGNWDPCLLLEQQSQEAFAPVSGTLSPTDEGPLLSGGQQPLSPTETESYDSGGPTPRDSTFGNRLASTATTHHNGRSVSSLHPAPRYVSSSAFPPTPLSVDPVLPSYGYGFMDRQSSFSAFTADMAGAAMGMMGHDMYRWDEQDDEYAAAYAGVSDVSGAWKRRESQVSVAVTAVTSTSPHDLQQQSPEEVVPRVQRAGRARSVAGSFS